MRFINSEYIRILKETVMAYLRYYSNRDSNQLLPGNMSRTLALE